jgi:hypothetical protein
MRNDVLNIYLLRKDMLVIIINGAFNTLSVTLK